MHISLPFHRRKYHAQNTTKLSIKIFYAYVENEQVAQCDKLACLNSKPEYSRKKGENQNLTLSHKACPKTKKSYQWDPLHLFSLQHLTVHTSS